MNSGRIPTVVPALPWTMSEKMPTEIAWYLRSRQGRWMPQTWETVWRQIAGLSAILGELGLSEGDRVAIRLGTGPEWEIAQQAALVRGAVIVGLDSHASPDEAIWILRHARARWLFCSDTFLDVLPKETVDELKGVIFTGEPRPASERNVFRWNDLSDRTPGPSTGSEQVRRRRPDEIATILYTSGTTGEPKGIAVSHRQIMVAVCAICEAYPELSKQDTTLCWLPMSALFQRVMNLVSMACGMQFYFLDDPRGILETISEVSPSFFIGVPRFYEKLQEVLQQTPPEATEPWRDRMKCMISGSAPLARPITEYLFTQNLLVLEAYGLTENTVPMSSNRIHDYRFGSVGKPFVQNELRFEEDGEILVRGPGVFAGYIGDAPDSELFTEDGFYHTGDCGYLDEEGYLYLTGRKSEFIKTSTGRRLSPAAIEAAYAQSPYLDHVVVFGDGRKYLVALVTLKLPQIQAYLRTLGQPQDILDQQATTSVKDLVLAELNRLDAGLSQHERVQAVGILEGSLSGVRGELTAAGKLRRRVIGHNYGHIIERLYDVKPRGARVAWE